MADKERELTLVEGEDDYDRLKLELGTREHPNGLGWDAPVTEKPELGTTEIWDLVNTTVDTHLIHMHLVQFQVLGRRPFDVDQYNADREGGEVGPIADYYTGPIEPAAPNDSGWKDTIAADPGYVTQVIAPFGKFKGQFKDFTGDYVWHCHILEHEDHDMMCPYEVLPRGDDDGLFPDPLVAKKDGRTLFKIGPHSPSMETDCTKTAIWNSPTNKSPHSMRTVTVRSRRRMRLRWVVWPSSDSSLHSPLCSERTVISVSERAGFTLRPTRRQPARPSRWRGCSNSSRG